MKVVNGKIVIIALILVALIAAGCAGPSENATVPGSIKIGLVAPLSGGASDVGNDMKQAAILAVEEINAEGGVFVSEYGVKIPLELVEGDTQTSPTEGVTAVERLITNENVVVLVGGFSSGVTLANQVPAAGKVPYIITGASSSQVTRRTEVDTSYFFHYCSTTDDYSQPILQFFVDELKPLVAADRDLKLALIYRDDAYGKGVIDSSVAYIEENNLPVELVAQQKYPVSETDFHAYLTKIADAKPDAVYTVGFVKDTASIYIQGQRDVGLNTVYMAVECNEDPKFYELLGKWGDGQLLESKFAPYAPEYTEMMGPYKEAYLAKWGVMPGMMGADTYDGIYLVKSAIERAGTLDRTDVKDAIKQTNESEMLILMEGGNIVFDEYNEISPKIFIEQMFWNEETEELIPVIVLPENLKSQDFVLPENYEIGG
ncbi:MAG: ABC transporter substrate-binding protein [Methanosarcinales archaeon]|nr:ABC transporter substrate-binding protein [ANME-2 cluster archaeon]MDW7776719.1 ABC transporter substrate-binding protein [Methanosarcinales archaeon]